RSAHSRAVATTVRLETEVPFEESPFVPVCGYDLIGITAIPDGLHSGVVIQVFEIWNSTAHHAAHHPIAHRWHLLCHFRFGITCLFEKCNDIGSLLGSC